MFNPWGLVFIALGAALVFIGYKGSQNSVYSFVTGHRPDQAKGQKEILGKGEATQIGAGAAGVGGPIVLGAML